MASRRRPLRSSIGRFTALDPLGAKGGDTDWYGYCVDDPVNRVDAWGLAEAKVHLYESRPFGHIGVSVGNSTIYGKGPYVADPLDLSKSLWGHVPGVVREESPDRIPSRTVTIPITQEQEKSMSDYIGRSLKSPQDYNIRDESCVGFGGGVLRSGGMDAPSGSCIQPQQFMDYLEKRLPDEAPSDGFSTSLPTAPYEAPYD